MNIRFEPNTLYYGDCLDIMADFPEKSVDLIYLDPPFNSDRKYNSIFKNSGLRIDPQIKAFDDVWLWDDKSEERVERLKNAIANPASKVIAGFEGFIPQSKMLSYTSYMAERLFVMHGILKDTGSIYLHCDPYASHYLKLIMDAIFGIDNYLNEIVWQRTKSHISNQYGRIHDTILFYRKGEPHVWNPIHTEYDPAYIEKYYKEEDSRGLYQPITLTGSDVTQHGESGKPWRGINPSDVGRHWAAPRREAWPECVEPPENYESLSVHEKLEVLDENDLIHWPKTERGKVPRFKRYLSVSEGRRTQDLITDIENVGKTEDLGYPTQKPLALLERLINASSNEDYLVLDPFAGCGTAIEASLINRRKVIGIDILPFALRLINQHRILPHGLQPLPMQGVPVDMNTARHLALNDPFKFQDWSVSLIDGLVANPQKIGDDGIDGFGMLLHKPDNMDRKAIIVQVTGASGSQKAKYERLQATIRNENAAMGILITLDTQTAQRNWTHTLESVRMGRSTYAPIQCFSIDEYYQDNGRWDRYLKLPPLANPWTGKPMQTTLFEAAQMYE